MASNIAYNDDPFCSDGEDCGIDLTIEPIIPAPTPVTPAPFCSDGELGCTEVITPGGGLPGGNLPSTGVGFGGQLVKYLGTFLGGFVGGTNNGGYIPIGSGNTKRCSNGAVVAANAACPAINSGLGGSNLLLLAVIGLVAVLVLKEK